MTARNLRNIYKNHNCKARYDRLTERVIRWEPTTEQVEHAKRVINSRRQSRNGGANGVVIYEA